MVIKIDAHNAREVLQVADLVRVGLAAELLSVLLCGEPHGGGVGLVLGDAVEPLAHHLERLGHGDRR